MILPDLRNALRQQPSQLLRGQITVQFAGQRATDFGGLSREFVHLLSGEIFPDTSVFELVNLNQLCWFRRHARPDACQRGTLQAAGILLRIALTNGLTISRSFRSALFKLLKRDRLTISDLAKVDHALAGSLAAWRQDGRVAGADYGLSFAIPDVVNEESVTVAICDYAPDRKVTAANFDEYIEAIVDYKLWDSVEHCFRPFAERFNLAGETKVMGLLSAQDCQALIRGHPSCGRPRSMQSTSPHRQKKADLASIERLTLFGKATL